MPISAPRPRRKPSAKAVEQLMPTVEELTRRSQAWAEESYDELAGYFGREVRRRIPLIVYSSHRAFEQTNVTPFFLPEGVAGLTEFIKGRVLMPFNGSYSQFRTTLHHFAYHPGRAYV